MIPARRLVCAALLLPLAAIAAPKPKPKPAPPPKERVVIQVSDGDSKRWNLAIGIAKTLQAEFGEDKIDVAIITIGPGVNMLREDSDVANRIEHAISRKVFVMACGISMKTLNINEDALVRNVFVVPSGAVEIIKRQRSGWTYLRP